ncbi:L domain-like protein [Gonapodya prolifera JEL478]|uniref:L domain-like protein n=1 Tax=Gonapodya prolifera (strain JEL478) TaxID=1344416 RepID=A0A139AF21_GONPJ|nr:L domain-like protein [Gonapodya prolifera JEL478]|eukprot:KXS15411.1 L domain-like protein [Gonapodya prolifera JEL478]
MILQIAALLLLATLIYGQTEAIDCGLFETLYRNSNISLPWTAGKCCSLTYNSTQAPSFNCLNGRIVGAFLYQQNLSSPLPSLDGLTDVVFLWLYGNKLSGRIPSLSNLTRLQYLYIGVNAFEGPLPSFAGLPNLQYIDISRNRLNGSIPSLRDQKSLRQLTLNGNQLTGNVPDLSFLPSIDGLDLHSNNLAGNIDGKLPPLVTNAFRESKKSTPRARSVRPLLQLPQFSAALLVDFSCVACFCPCYCTFKRGNVKAIYDWTKQESPI